MKRTYVNRLPKNEEVKNTNIRVENGELIVEVEFEERFKPKDGDFLVNKNEKVFICIDENIENSLVYSAYCGVRNNNEISLDLSRIWTEKRGCRYATIQEKNAFLERLEKEYHKRWNEENKCLEDIRWIPKEHEIYYYIDSDGTIDFTNFLYSYNQDKGRIEIGNYFKTEEAAQKVADQIKEIFKNSKAE